MKSSSAVVSQTLISTVHEVATIMGYLWRLEWSFSEKTLPHLYLPPIIRAVTATVTSSFLSLWPCYFLSHSWAMHFHSTDYCCPWVSCLGWQRVAPWSERSSMLGLDQSWSYWPNQHTLDWQPAQCQPRPLLPPLEIREETPSEDFDWTVWVRPCLFSLVT